MGGHLYGFVETRFAQDDVSDNWELVLKTEPILGAQSELRDVFYKNSRKNYFPEIPKNKGFPENISSETRATIYTRIRLSHLDTSDIEVNTEDIVYANTSDENSLSTYGDKRWAIDLDMYKNFEKEAFWITYDQLKQISWDQKVLESKVEKIRNKMEDSGYGYKTGELQKVFKLLIDGSEVARNWITHDDEVDLSPEEVRKLVRGNKLTKNGKNLRIERRNMKEMLGDNWSNVWNIIEELGENKLRDVRVVFYWNH